MKIPESMTEEEVITIITKVSNRIAPAYVFYGYTTDDIKQESFIICMDALERYDNQRSLENFLSVHLSNRLKNFVRDKHFTMSNDINRINLTQPAQLDNENTIVGNNKYKDLDNSNMVEIINRLLPANCRMDYLKIINDVYVPKPRREEIKDMIVDILDNYGYHGEDYKI